MHAHDDLASARDTLRPRTRLDDDRPEPAMLGAAVEGRSDVLGTAGLLGLQRVVGNSAVQRVAAGGGEHPVTSVLRGGGGSPLPGPVREDMEGRFGSDFSDVRIHADAAAHEAATAVGAHAYTSGRDIVFQRGMYDPESVPGRTMLAHELTHVVQQSAGPVDGTPTGSGFQVSDPSDRFEREASDNAQRIVAMDGNAIRGAAGPAPAVTAPTSPGPVQRVAIQREEDEEPVQGAFVQREEDEEAVQGSFADAPSVQRDEQEGDEG